MSEQIYDSEKVYLIDLDEIYADAGFNCRGVIDAIACIDLANSIREDGLQQPIMIQPWTPESRWKPPHNERFRIVAGYRRFKAMQINRQNGVPDSDTIRCLIKEGLSDLDSRVLNLKENVQREDLNMQQEALAIRPFQMNGWTEQQTATRIGKSRGWVQVRYMLLILPEDIQIEAALGNLNQQQVRNLWEVATKSGSMEELYQMVRDIKERRLKGVKREVKPSDVLVTNRKKLRKEQELFEMQTLLRELFGNSMATKVVGWAAALVSDLEMHQYIQEQAKAKGIKYEIPAGLEGTHAQRETVTV